MKRTLTVFLILALALTLWACGKDPAPTTQPNATSKPSASQPSGSGNPLDPTTPSQPGGETELERPDRRPAHELSAFQKIMGWYIFEYEGDSRYPSKVMVTDFDGNVKQHYELVFDANGLPIQLVIKSVHGETLDSAAELTCDDKGNIVEVGIYEGEEKIGCYRLDYDANGRMITTTMDMQGIYMVLSYDERYCVTHVVATQGDDYAEMELAYDDLYQVTKRLVKDRDGVIQFGFEDTYTDGILTLHKVYEAGICSEEITYNEAGKAVLHLFRYMEDGQLLEAKRTYEYNAEGCYTIDYDANGNVVGKAFIQLDEQDRVLKNIAYDTQGNVLETREYAYDAAGNIIRDYLYSSDGTLLRGVESAYDEYDNVTKNMVYDANGLVEGWEREYDAEGNTLKRVDYFLDGGYEVRLYLPGSWDAYKTMVYDAEGNPRFGYEWEYDADGNAVKYTAYETDGSYSVKEYRPGETEPYKSMAYDAQGNIISGYEEIYDENGRLTEKTEYEPDGWKSVYTYGENGGSTANYYQNDQLRQTIVTDAMDNITLIVSYDENGQETDRYEASYTYYENGVLHTQTVHQPNGQLYTVYDQRGNKIEHTITEWYADETFEQKWVYTYDENDILRKEEEYINDYLWSVTEYNENGVICLLTECDPYGYFVHEYDARGFEITGTDYNLDGTKNGWWTYERFDNGQVKVRLGYYADGTLKERAGFTEDGLETFWEIYGEDGALQQKYIYSEPGVKTEMVHYPEYGGKEVTHFDEQGNETETIVYDENDAVLNRTTYAYDENGRLVQTNCYHGWDALFTYEVFAYYDNGVRKSHICYHADGSVMSEIYFDEEGNMIF